MTEGSFPRPAKRFASVGFSEIVVVRNRVMDLLAAGHRVWRFEGGEPYMATPDPMKEAMGGALQRNETRYAPSSGIPDLRKAILEKVRTRNGIPAEAESPIDALSPREREVLSLMAEGRTNNAIAEQLVVTSGAVEKHVSSIFGKLNLSAAGDDHRRVLAVLAFLRATDGG